VKLATLGTAGQAASGALTKFSGALPAIGIAVAAVGFVFEQEQKTVNDWAQAMLNGGQAAQQAMAEIQRQEQAGLAPSDWWERAKGLWNDGIAQIEGYGSAADQAAQKSKQLYDAMSPLQQRQQDVTKATNDLQAVLADPRHTAAAAADASDNLGRAQSALASFQTQVDTATKNASTSLGGFKGALQTTADAASAANTQINLLKGSLDALTGKTVTMDEAEVAVTNATIAATTALQGKSGALVDATGKLNLNTEAGAAAFTALKNLAGADNTLISTMEQQGATTDQVKAKDAQLRDSFIQTAEKMGFSADEAHQPGRPDLRHPVGAECSDQHELGGCRCCDPFGAGADRQPARPRRHHQHPLRILGRTGCLRGARFRYRRLREGGVVPGYAPGVDSVHAMLSPGEGVLVPEAVRGLGGAAAIQAINSGYSSRARLRRRRRRRAHHLRPVELQHRHPERREQHARRHGGGRLGCGWCGRRGTVGRGRRAGAGNGGRGRDLAGSAAAADEPGVRRQPERDQPVGLQRRGGTRRRA
jgi:hypothetical protein